MEDEKSEVEAGWAILGVPLCLSLDNLVAGIGLESLGQPVIPTVIVIGTVSGVMSLAGLTVGRLGRLYLPASVERLLGSLARGTGRGSSFRLRICSWR